MNTSRIAIIGGGNLGAAIAEGLIKSKFISPDLHYSYKKKC